MKRALLLLALSQLLMGALYEWGGSAARGVRALEARRYEEALAALREGHADLPRSAALRYDQGLALEKMGRPAESQAAYRAALAQRGDHARAAAAFNLGSLAMSAERFGDAVRWYRESLRVRPSDAATKRALGEAVRRARNAPPKAPPRGAAQGTPPAGGGPSGSSSPSGSPQARGTTPPHAPRGSGGDFTREEAEHWLDALEA